ncbi:MAG: hypothetical protein AAB736_00720 [Patescibacteria group bacterium]
MRPIQLKFNFLELKKQEDEESIKERRKDILLIVVMGACYITLVGCGWVLKFYEVKGGFLATSIFLRILFRFGLILSGIGLMLGAVALVADATKNNEKPSPKLKIQS